MRANAEVIYQRVAAGSMPCDGAWPAADVERFRTWIDNGSPYHSAKPILSSESPNG